MLEQFDDNVLNIIKKSFEYTNKHFKLNKIGTESMLYIMFKEEESICNFLLEDYRVGEEEIKEIISKYIIIRNQSSEYTDKFLEVMETAKKVAKENKSEYVKEEHLFYALLVVKDTMFFDQIIRLNINPLDLIDDLKEYFSFKANQEINSYSISMTELAKNNKLNKMIGREKYIERMQIILNRKNKNNIMLVGSAGVGKTALVEGLCYELLQQKSNYNVISLNVSSLIANTKYRGDFEARINRVLEEVINSENSILFIDEIHTIVGAGASDNLLDIANIIKPYLVRNNFRCIGATTQEEYQKTIMKDKALARRFQPIFVNELNERETLDVLEGIQEDFTNYYGVSLTKEMFSYIIKLCKDKMGSRKFPDKAIDLLDESMCIAKKRGNSSLKLSDVDQGFVHITGTEKGVLDYNFLYNELEPYFLDNYLGINEKKNLVSITFKGNDDNLKLLIEELKIGFGITSEMVLEMNMSNYVDQTSISSLIGSSPGYVGYDDGGVLSEHFSKFLYQILVIHKLELASNDIKDLFFSMKERGFFYDKKGREFKTNNTVFIFVLEDIKNEKIGFIKNEFTTKDYNFNTVLFLLNKKEFVVSNPYISSLKYQGYDLSFKQEEFDKYSFDYKKKFLEILLNYEKGKYLLEYDEQTKKIEILTLG